MATCPAIQELETLKRQGCRILICAMNDGGYGSEFHKLRADGLDDSLAARQHVSPDVRGARLMR
jgi:hypothetical protein